MKPTGRFIGAKTVAHVALQGNGGWARGSGGHRGADATGRTRGCGNAVVDPGPCGVAGGGPEREVWGLEGGRMSVLLAFLKGPRRVPSILSTEVGRGEGGDTRKCGGNAPVGEFGVGGGGVNAVQATAGHPADCFIDSQRGYPTARLCVLYSGKAKSLH